MSQLASAPRSQRAHHRWKLLLALAALLVVLGFSGLTVSTFLQLTSLFVFGPMLLVSSILQLLIAFFTEDRKQSLMHLAAAGLEMIFGFFIMGNPVENVMSLVSVVAVFLIVISLARLDVCSRRSTRLMDSYDGACSIAPGCLRFAGPEPPAGWLFSACALPSTLFFTSQLVHDCPGGTKQIPNA